MEKSKQIALLLLLCSLILLPNLATFEPDLMESRNFAAAREIVQGGSWWFPTMNGEPRLAKPPLPTWLTVVSAQPDGLYNYFWMRLPGALVAMAMVLFCFAFVRRMTRDPWTPFICAAMLASCHLVILMGRTNSWDIPSVAFMLGALYFFYKGWLAERKAYKEFALGGLLFGLSIFSKGPVSLYAMLLPFLIAFGFTHGWKTIGGKWKELLVGLVVVLLISLPWPLSVLYFLPDASGEVAARETNSWANRHVRPFYYYLHFPLFTGVWIFLFLASLVVPYARKRVEGNKNYRFLLIWVLSALVLLSLIPTKKERYLLPMLPPMAMMAGFFFRGWWLKFQEKKEQLPDRILLWVFGGVVGLAMILLPFTTDLLSLIQPNRLSGLTIDLGGSKWWITILFPCLGGLVFSFLWRKQIFNFWATTLVSVAFFMVFVIPILPELYYQNPDYQGAEQLREIESIADLPFYSDGEMNMTNVWKSGKVIRKIDFNDPESFNKLPFVLISGKPWEKIGIIGKFKDQISAEEIRDLDYYRKTQEHRLYVTVLRSIN